MDDTEESGTDMVTDMDIMDELKTSMNQYSIIIYTNKINPKYSIRTTIVSFAKFWGALEDITLDYYNFKNIWSLCKKCSVFPLISLIILGVYLIMVDLNLFETNTQITQAGNVQAGYRYCEELYNNYLTILDIVFLGSLSYAVTNETDEIGYIVDSYFENATENGWELKWVQPLKPGFYHLSNTKHNFDVIGIRGTFSKSDILQNLDLFTIPALLRTVSIFIPISNVFPTVFLQNYVDRAIHISEYLVSGTTHKKIFVDNVYNYIRWNLYDKISRNNNNTDYNLYIIGHSLGGAIANIVASQLHYEGYINIKPITFNAPGLLWSSRYFRIDDYSYESISYQFLMSNDIVSNAVDIHIGEQLWFECNSQQRTLSCHILDNYYVEILNHCSTNNIKHAISNKMFNCMNDVLFQQHTIFRWIAMCIPNRDINGNILYPGNNSIPINITQNYQNLTTQTDYFFFTLNFISIHFFLIIYLYLFFL